MSHPAAKPVTKTQAKKVMGQVKAQFASWIDNQHPTYGPVLVEDYDGRGNPAVVWEDGAPYEWSLLAFHGGIEEEFGFRVPEVAPVDGVFAEPVNGHVLGLYPAF